MSLKNRVKKTYYSSLFLILTMDCALADSNMPFLSPVKTVFNWVGVYIKYLALLMLALTLVGMAFASELSTGFKFLIGAVFFISLAVSVVAWGPGLFNMGTVSV